MSTVRTNTLSNAAGSASVPVDTVINGSAKAWVNFNGTGTVAIRAAFNVSSITDNDVGDYTVNFTNAMVDANYVANVSMRTVVGSASLSNVAAATAPTTSAIRVIAFTTGGSLADTDYLFVSIFRRQISTRSFK